ncbi:MAG: FMN-binding negative transcriptional regulator [Candidatus Limnocylindrales bacterium]
MYQPAHGRFAVPDPVALLAELSAAAPATLVTHDADGFHTTVLPLRLDLTAGDHGTLAGHIALPNPQWASAGGAGAIAVFLGPDAYVTPRWYAETRRTGRVVPTWNYVTVVAHGTLVVQRDPAWLARHLRRLVEQHEADRPDPWSVEEPPQGSIEGQARGIVGLELRIDRVDAKRKLSQNRSEDDVAGVIAGLAEGGLGERAVAEEMRRDAERRGDLDPGPGTGSCGSFPR